MPGMRGLQNLPRCRLTNAVRAAAKSFVEGNLRNDHAQKRQTVKEREALKPNEAHEDAGCQ